MRRLLSVVFWSVIAAAFIGPGTVTTCASAGAAHGFVLLWALLFSTVACLVLQEAAARVTVVSGLDLSRAIRRRAGAGAAGTLVMALALGAIVLGCAAYEAGNILGAAAGAGLLLDLPAPAFALVFGGFAVVLLGAGTTRTVVRVLSVLVAVMGLAFLATAAVLAPSLPALAAGTLVPRLPSGSALLVIALVGTTVVPYNIFLGSGIAGGQNLGELRFGLAVAVGLGGLISMAILVVGSLVPGPFSFQALASVLGTRLGPWASTLFALGLFAAGLSSAITAPLAAAVTTRGLLAPSRDDGRWAEDGWRYRAVWLAVVGTGILFGVTGVRPVPAIIAAQALNGLLLPVAAVFLLLTVNDRSLMGAGGLNSATANAAMVLVTAVAVVLGTASAVRAGAAALSLSPPAGAAILATALAVTALVAWPVWRAAARRRAARPESHD